MASRAVPFVLNDQRGLIGNEASRHGSWLFRPNTDAEFIYKLGFCQPQDASRWLLSEPWSRKDGASTRLGFGHDSGAARYNGYSAAEPSGARHPMNTHGLEARRWSVELQRKAFSVLQ
ncbi:hypothetical protein E4U43_007274 [Claviceps pusilla]|uniref:Uncharacterized protein n=1 Tax=Claviceps pusilla TaxID=123648 RepID=A0A9P7SY80_9HYPO|nr:hypothetical protein E4U43_007274 [Claviceps pusilla]